MLVGSAMCPRMNSKTRFGGSGRAGPHLCHMAPATSPCGSTAMCFRTINGLPPHKTVHFESELSGKTKKQNFQLAVGPWLSPPLREWVQWQRIPPNPAPLHTARSDRRPGPSRRVRAAVHGADDGAVTHAPRFSTLTLLDGGGGVYERLVTEALFKPPGAYRDGFDFVRRTAGNYNIDIGSLDSLLILVLPLDRQHRCTQVVETVHSAIAVEESRYRTTLALRITLMCRLLRAGA